MSIFSCRTAVALLGLIGTVLSPAPAAARESRDATRAERGYAPLRPVADCLDPARARGWHRLSGDRLLVDAGRRAFLLTLSHDCPGLGVDTGIGFASRNPGGRICGDIGDAVVPAGPALSLPRACAVARVTVLTGPDADRMLVDDR